MHAVRIRAERVPLAKMAWAIAAGALEPGIGGSAKWRWRLQQALHMRCFPFPFLGNPNQGMLKKDSDVLAFWSSRMQRASVFIMYLLDRDGGWYKERMARMDEGLSKPQHLCGLGGTFLVHTIG